MRTYNNYWNIKLSDLPTRGLFYNENAEIIGRPLNLLEIKFLTTLNEEIASDVIDSIFSQCFELKNIEYKDLYLADREWLIFWLRVNSFKETNGYNIDITCINCGNRFNQNIKLTDFDIKYLDEDISLEYVDKLPDSKMNFSISLPKVKDIEITHNEPDIEKLSRYIKFDNIDKKYNPSFIEDLTAMDFLYLNNIVEQYECGFVKYKTIYCPNCDTEHKIELIFDETNLFGQMNLFDIMEIVLQISKYTNFQIPDTTPWLEIEVMQEVVNKMAKQEKEAIEKNSGNSNMSMPSLGALKSKMGI